MLKHRWPTGVGIATMTFFAVVSRVLAPEFEGYFLAWGVLVSAGIYLSWGAGGGVSQRRGPLMVQTFGVLGFGSIALAGL